MAVNKVLLSKDFFYELPEQLIAKYPHKQRSISRLLCLNKTTKQIEHKKFVDLVNLLQAGDLLVLNNSRVLKARLYGHKLSGGKVELLIETINDSQHAIAYIKASKSVKPGTIIQIIADNNNYTIEILSQIAAQDGRYTIRLVQDLTFEELLDNCGHIPLPPYMKRAAEQIDLERYQTVYSKTLGSIAAPTAGLHFDQELLTRLTEKGVKLVEITLHVGSGTFQPIRVENLQEHVMHTEQISVSAAVCEQINQVKAAGGRVIAVGTTATRAIETAAFNGDLKPYTGFTNLFIQPGFPFKVIDGMITNFHLPSSTLLVLVCALAGREEILNAYNIAIHQEYKFYSYGDAMFIY